MPKLYAFLRKGAFGSAPDAILPFVSQIPPQLWNDGPQHLIKIFFAAWTSLQDGTAPLFDTTQKLLHECLVWGLMSAHTLVAEDLVESFSVQLFRETLMETLHDTLLPDHEPHPCDAVLLKLLSQCLCTFAAASVKPESHEKPRHVFRLLAKIVTEFFFPLLDGTEAATAEDAISDLFLQVSQSETLNADSQGRLFEDLALPLGSVLTRNAYAPEMHSSSAASCLLTSSRALGRCLVQFQPPAQTDSYALRIFIGFKKLYLAGVQDSQLMHIHGDILIHAFSRATQQARTAQWKAILTHLHSYYKTDPAGSMALLLNILSRLDVHVEHTPMPGLVTKEMGTICDFHLEQWAKNRTSAELCTSLVKRQKTLLTPATYSRLLQFFRTQKFTDGLTHDLDILVAQVTALFSPQALEDTGKQIRDLWIKMTTRLVIFAWGLVPIDKKWEKATRVAWKSGKRIAGLDDEVLHDLSLSLQDVVVKHIHRELPDSLPGPETNKDLRDEGAGLEKRITEVMGIKGTVLGQFLERVFGKGLWTKKYDKGKLSTKELLNQQGIFIVCTPMLILKHGAKIFKTAPSIVRPVFVEHLCELNVGFFHCCPLWNVFLQAKEDVQLAIMECLVDEVMHERNPSLTMKIMSQCLDGYMTSILLSSGHYLSGLRVMIGELTKHSQHRQVMRVLESFTAKLAAHIIVGAVLPVKTLARSEDTAEGQDIWDLEEDLFVDTPAGLLPHLVPLLRCRAAL